MRGVWREDGSLFAEVSLAEAQTEEAGRFLLHPVLLDALGHPGIYVALGDREGAGAFAPSAWRGLRVHAPGASTLRLRLEMDSERRSLVAVDTSGAPVLSIDSIAERAVEPAELQAARNRRSLFRIEWSQAPHRRTAGAGLRVASLGELDSPQAGTERYRDLPALVEAIEGGASIPDMVLADAQAEEGELPGAAHGTARRALELAQAWIAVERLQRSRLVFVTRNALALQGETPNLVTAPLAGLVHAARSEHHGRFGLVDMDGADGSWPALRAALDLGADEPQVAIRDGVLLLPRLARAGANEAPEAQPIDPDTTVLITDGTSGAGALVARHLAAQHGAQHLFLLSRHGQDANGTSELGAELEELGADVSIVACDASDRGQLEAAIASIGPKHPLGAVVHSAGVVDNGVVESLTPERLERVLRAKVDAAWNLHALTEQMDLSQFLLFSAAGGVLGGAAQAHQAAADVFLDSLAAHRRSRGFPATSIAWGGWGRGAEPDGTERARAERLGFTAIPPQQGLELFDIARASEEALLVPVGLEVAALRARAEAGMLPPVFSALVSSAQHQGDRAGSLRAKLAAAPVEERESIVLDLLCGHIAVVLGQDSPDDVDPDLVFQEMGFDSLGTVELRNRLTGATDLPVPILALADYPTPRAAARYLLAELEATTDGGGPSSGVGGADGSIADRGVETSFVALLDEAMAQGTLGDFVDLITAASKFRPTIAAPTAASAIQPVRLNEGGEEPSLVLIPSPVPTSGSHEYVKLGRAFEGDRPVLSLPLPGFIAGERLPDSIAALSAMQVEAILEADVGPDFILAGHSAGGWMAHSLASHLEDLGIGLAAVVLLDTYPPGAGLLEEMVPAILGSVHAANEANAGIDDVRLTAMGGYRRIFASWRPRELSVPTVVVRATELAWGTKPDDSEWQVMWDLPHVSVDVPGDHFSIVTDHAESTAEAIRSAMAPTASLVHDGPRKESSQ